MIREALTIALGIIFAVVIVGVVGFVAMLIHIWRGG